MLLHGILARAKRLGWIGSNPAENAERVSITRSGDFNVLTPEEVLAVAGAAGSEQDAAVILVAAFTGLRLGELRGLRFADVDFALQRILVRGNYVQGASGLPKSGKVRSVPLNDQAARALDQLSRREHFTAPDDLVFCSEVGEHRDDGSIRRAFYQALDAAGLGDKRTGPTRSGSTICATRSARWPHRSGRCMTCRRTWATRTSPRRWSMPITSLARPRPRS